MPDLTIKPVAAAGNKLILQDQAGGAVLTTADSGVTIANASLTAPTVANMSNFTFPAGHVLQTKNYIDTSRQTHNGQTWASVVSGAITISVATHEVIAVLNSSFGQKDNDNSIGIRLYRGATAIASGTGEVDCLSSQREDGGSNWRTGNLSATVKDTPGTGTHTYYVKVCAWGTNTMYVNGSQANAGTFGSGDARGSSSLSLWEVVA
tara:strand:- start:325 stop:945 length:621 start_codon:yes stop_codon:yes gene_type:complete